MYHPPHVKSKFAVGDQVHVNQVGPIVPATDSDARRYQGIMSSEQQLLLVHPSVYTRCIEKLRLAEGPHSWYNSDSPFSKESYLNALSRSALPTSLTPSSIYTVLAIHYTSSAPASASDMGSPVSHGSSQPFSAPSQSIEYVLTPTLNDNNAAATDPTTIHPMTLTAVREMHLHAAPFAPHDIVIKTSGPEANPELLYQVTRAQPYVEDQAPATGATHQQAGSTPRTLPRRESWERKVLYQIRDGIGIEEWVDKDKVGLQKVDHVRALELATRRIE